jgi:hypothetical protein
VSRQDKEYSPEKASRQFAKSTLRVWVVLGQWRGSVRAKHTPQFRGKKRLDWLDWPVEKEFFAAEEMVGAKGFKPSTSWSRTKS